MIDRLIVRRALFVLATWLALSSAALSQVNNRAEMDCDRLAGRPGDEKNLIMEVPGVPISKIDAQAAIKACQDAVGANPGEPRLLLQLGRAFAAGKQLSEAVSRYEQAASLDYTPAVFLLGYAYFNGEGVQKNEAAGVRFYRKAADAGDRLAMGYLAGAYELGRGVAQDYSAAKQWAEKASALGNTNAMVTLGTLYRKGHGVTQDYAVAKQWYEKAASLKNGSAANKLGIMYQEGEGSSPDWVTAKLWYEKGANLNNPAAMFNLGLMHELGGPGISRDIDVAFKWYEKASALGDEPALKRINRRNKQMEDWARGQRSAQEAVDSCRQGCMRALDRCAKEPGCLPHSNSKCLDMCSDNFGQRGSFRYRP
jgi:TPR repeat protein